MHRNDNEKYNQMSYVYHEILQRVLRCTSDDSAGHAIACAMHMYLFPSIAILSRYLPVYIRGLFV